MMTHPLIKKDDVKFVQKSHWLNKTVDFKQASLSRQAGMAKSNVNLNVLGPDMDSTELHAHSNAEEWIYVLKGSGTLILLPPPSSGQALNAGFNAGDEEKVEKKQLGPGDFVGLPIPQWAHMIHSGSEGIEYLVGANATETDICQYPLKNETLVATGGQRTHFSTDQLKAELHGR